MGLSANGTYLKQQLQDKLIEHKHYMACSRFHV